MSTELSPSPMGRGQGNAGGWPSSSGNPSGGGRSNNTAGSGRNLEFECRVEAVIDGDSVFVRRTDANERVAVRVGGVDVASSGASALAAMHHIQTNWVGHLAFFKETCCNRPHGEVPGILTKRDGSNLGKELLQFGRRLHFPIEGFCDDHVGQPPDERPPRPHLSLQVLPGLTNLRI